MAVAGQYGYSIAAFVQQVQLCNLTLPDPWIKSWTCLCRL